MPENLQEEIENRGYKNTVTKERDEDGKEGLLVILTKKDRYYFIENKKVREATKEEFSNGDDLFYSFTYDNDVFIAEKCIFNAFKLFMRKCQKHVFKKKVKFKNRHKNTNNHLKFTK